ncbi:MAG: hypothetical protein ACTSWL_04405 [Promethearchaeota archaeon]
MSNKNTNLMMNAELIPKILHYIANVGIIDFERMAMDLGITQNLVKMILEYLVKENYFETDDQEKMSCEMNIQCSHCPFAKSCGSPIKKQYILTKKTTLSFAGSSLL